MLAACVKMSRPTYLKIWFIRRKKEYNIKEYIIKEVYYKEVENSFLHGKEKKLSTNRDIFNY